MKKSFKRVETGKKGKKKRGIYEEKGLKEGKLRKAVKKRGEYMKKKF